ncbi:MAG: TIGR00730 family Rossman fold protein [bacterium]|nr:TIGR00730 family Rossman fold protein [bacterium]
MIKMSKNDKENLKNGNSRKKILVPASKLPAVGRPKKIADFRETAQWRIFRIMSEFVDGFQFLADIKKSVTFFGSARTAPEDYHYIEAEKLAGLLAKAGYSIVTGGGPGIMEAANKGASEAGGESIGFNIQLPEEQRVNSYVKKGIGFYYFFSRKLMLSYSAQSYVFFPGGFGTLDEFFELTTLIQTKKISKKIAIIAVGKDFWQPLFDHIEKVIYEKYHAIDKEDMKIYHLVDSAEEAFKIIKKSKPREIII